MRSQVRWLAIVPSAFSTLLCSGLLISSFQTAAGAAPLAGEVSDFGGTATHSAPVSEIYHSPPKQRIARLAAHEAARRARAHRARVRARRARAAALAAAQAAAAASPSVPAPAPAPSQPAPAPAGGGYGAAPGSFQACVINAESGGNPQAVNPTSDAGGLYQFLPSTWAGLGYAVDYPGGAQTAPPSVQTEAFFKLYAEAGTAPWAGDGCA